MPSSRRYGFWHRPQTRIYGANLTGSAYGDYSNETCNSNVEGSRYSRSRSIVNDGASSSTRNQYGSSSSAESQEKRVAFRASSHFSSSNDEGEFASAFLKNDSRSNRRKFLNGQESSLRFNSTSNSKRNQKYIDDDICYKVADVRMSPFSKGRELDEAITAKARSEARIAELQREMDLLTMSALTTAKMDTSGVSSAKALSKRAMHEETLNRMSSSSSMMKSKKVTTKIESESGSDRIRYRVRA